MQSYFSHDSNARNSEKMLKLRMELGAEGYGIYFMLLERLRDESDYMSLKDYNMLAFDLRVDSSVIKKVVEDFDLFILTKDSKKFYSESFLRRMEMKDAKSQKKSQAGKMGAKARWDKEKAVSKDSINEDDKWQPHSSAIAVPTKKMASKVKESKVNKSKEKESKKSTQKLDVISEYTSNENLRNTILAFKDMRKTIKKPLTDHALKLLLNKLDKLEDSDSGKIAVLEQSIMNSWQGVFELKGQAKQEVVRERERKEGVQVGVIQKI